MFFLTSILEEISDLVVILNFLLWLMGGGQAGATELIALCHC
jgi:hypothetical protein